MLAKNLFTVITTIVLMLIGLVSFPVTGRADEKQGCLFQGSWYGFNADGKLGWTANVQGQSTSSGTTNLEQFAFDTTLGGYFPTAVRASTIRGSWERSDGNTFRWTGIGLVVDEDGSAVWIGKISVIDTLMNSCNMEWIEATLEVFSPTQDPFIDEPLYGGFQLPGHYGYRMRVDPLYSD